MSSYTEKLASCQEDGTLNLVPELAEDVAKERLKALAKMPKGVAKTRAYLDFADFCFDNKLEREAVDAYIEVMRCISWSKPGAEKPLLDKADLRLRELSVSADEYVWEMASQVSGEYHEVCSERDSSEA